MNGDKYKGEMKDDYEHGKGVKIYNKDSPFVKIEGIWERGVAHGMCSITLWEKNHIKISTSNHVFYFFVEKRSNFWVNFCQD